MSHTDPSPVPTRPDTDAPTPALDDRGARNAAVLLGIGPAPSPVPEPGETPAEESAVVPGARFGNAVVRRFLGRGGMGRVYFAQHEGFQLPVVVKLLHAAEPEGEAVERFLREARVAVRLDHPHIVRVYDVGREGDRVYLVMDWIEGQNLEEYARDHAPVPVAEALRLVGQAARGLAHAHAQGVIHRDVKPANLMRRSRDGRVVVVDFGLARARALDRLTRDHATMGTLPFMAPEMFARREIGTAVDVYALGVTLYRLLTGRLPVEGELGEVLAFHQRGEAMPPVSRLRPVPEAVDALAARMMRPAAEDRPAAAAVATEIEDLLRTLGEPAIDADGDAHTPAANASPVPAAVAGPAHADVPTIRRTSPAPGLPARRSAMWGVALAVAACLAGWALAVAGPGGPRPDGASGRFVEAGLAVLLGPPVARGVDGAEVGNLPVAAAGFPRERIQPRDGIRFALRGAEPLHVYVFLVDPGGQVSCLFPDYYRSIHGELVRDGKLNGEPSANPLSPAAGVLLAPPIGTAPGGARRMIWYRFDEAKGTEWFLVAAARAPIPELEDERTRCAKSAGDAVRLRALASRWEAEAVPLAGADLPVLVHVREGEKALGGGWRMRRAPDRVAWTFELEHR